MLTHHRRAIVKKFERGYQPFLKLFVQIILHLRDREYCFYPLCCVNLLQTWFRSNAVAQPAGL